MYLSLLLRASFRMLGPFSCVMLGVKKRFRNAASVTPKASSLNVSLHKTAKKCLSWNKNKVVNGF